MNKRRAHHYWIKIRAIKPVYFLVVAAVFGLIAVAGLRQNNQRMIELREAVYAADEQGGDVQGALEELRAYVYAHMNTNLSSGDLGVYPPIQLKHTYDRLVAQRGSEVAAKNQELYSEAQAYCETVFQSGSSLREDRVPCIQEYTRTHPIAEPAPVPDSLYKFNFASPTWSPDLAGWSLLLAIGFLALFILSFTLDKWFRKNVA